MRAVIYARYSSDMQSATSVDDQVRECRKRAEADGHAVVNIFSDHAISGSTLGNRPGMLSLMDAAKDGGVNLVYAEALDRLSRDQEDIAGLYKRLDHCRCHVSLTRSPRATDQRTAYRAQGHHERPISQGPRRKRPNAVASKGASVKGKSAGWQRVRL